MYKTFYPGTLVMIYGPLVRQNVQRKKSKRKKKNGKKEKNQRNNRLKLRFFVAGRTIIIIVFEIVVDTHVIPYNTPRRPHTRRTLLRFRFLQEKTERKKKARVFYSSAFVASATEFRVTPDNNAVIFLRF